LNESLILWKGAVIMDSIEQKKFINYVVLEIQNIFNVSKEEAEEAVGSTGFLILLKRFPNQVSAYNIEYWANEIYQAFQNQIK
jgi:hypothetical protein